MEDRGEAGTSAPAADARGGYMRRFGLWVAIALALIFVTIAYSMIYDALIGRVTPTITVREGTVEKFARCEALIIRDERLVKASVAGVFNQVAQEGERLAKGGVAARIGGSPEPEEEGSGSVLIREAEEASLILQRAEAVLSDARIFLSAKEAELAIYANRGDPKGVNRLEAEVFEAKERIASAAKLRDAAAAEYEAKAEAAIEESETAVKEPVGIKVRTERQAVVSFGWDGLEDDLSPSNPSLFEIDFAVAADTQTNSRRQGDLLAKGDVVFREVGSLSTDVLMEIEGVDPDFLVRGRTYRIRFTRLSSEKVPAKLTSAKLLDGGSIRAYFSLDRYVNSMTNLRSAETELLLESYSGLVIPERAITLSEGRSVVFVLRKDRFIAVEVEVLGIVDGDAAVRSDALRQGDKIRYDG